LTMVGRWVDENMVKATTSSLALVIDLQVQSMREREAMDSDTLSSRHSRSLQDPPSRSNPSDQDSIAPLTRGDLFIVTFVTSLWLWATVWAFVSAAFR